MRDEGGENGGEKAPSKVKPTIFSLCRAQRSPGGRLEAVERMVGAHEVGLSAECGVVVHAAAVPFNARRFDAMAPKPGFGMLALFGVHDAIDELQRWRGIARNSHAEFAYAELSVNVGEIDMRLSSRQSRKAQGRRGRFLNLRRTTAEFQREIRTTFRRYVHEEGGDLDRAMAEIRQIASRSDLFDRLLYEDEQLQHVDVFVLPLADMVDGSGRIRQVACLLPGARIVGFTQGSDQVEVRLPGWMSDARTAKRLRQAALEPVAS